MTNFNYIDLYDHIHILKPHKGRIGIKYEFECPSCTGKLTMSPTDGTKFTCWGGCNHSAVRKVLLELSGEAAEWKKGKAEERQAAWEQNRLKREQEDEAKRLSLTPSVIRHQEMVKKIAANPLTADDISSITESRKVTPEMLQKYGFHKTWAGIAAPVFSYDGQMIDGQHKVSITHGFGSEQKVKSEYRWIAKGRTKRQETGQNPITVLGNRTNPTVIALCEGLMFKPIIAAENHPDWLVIGAGGGQFIQSSREFLSAVKRHPGVPVVFMADGGSAKDEGVMSRIASTHSILASISREMLIGEWGQYEKGGTDIDEIDPSTVIEFITLRQLQSVVGTVTNLGQGIRIGRSNAVKRESLENSFNLRIGTIEQAINVYSFYVGAHGLTKQLEQAIEDRVKYLLDHSGCGSGKSYSFGKSANPKGIKKVFYVHKDHRKPTTESIEESMADVPSRHNGLFVNPDRKTPLGNKWIQVSQPEGADWEMTQSNCHLANEQQKWAASGYANSDEKNPICHSCEHKSSCAISSGDGYGYIYQRGGALSNARVAIAPSALPRSTEYNYSNDMTVWDDQPITFYKELSVTYTQIRQTIGEIAMTEGGSDLLEELELITVPIQRALETPEFYGHRHSAIFGDLELPNAESLLNRVMAIIQPNPLNLVHKGNEGKADKLAQYGFKSPSKPRLEDVVQNWLGQILEIFAGKIEGVVSISGNKLIVKQRSTEHADIMKKCKLNLIMDATMSVEDLAKILSVDVSEIRVISQARAEFPNENVVVVTGMSSPGKQRADSMNERLDALEKSLIDLHGSCKTIDHIKASGKYLWHRDSTGSNAFKNDGALIIVGKPVPNMGAVADEYYFLTGNLVDPRSKDPEYQAFLDRKTAAACIQAANRLRAQHRPDQEVWLYIVSDKEDYPIAEVMTSLPGAKLFVKSVEDICIDAASSKDKTKIAIAKLIEANPKITMVQVAEATGKSVPTIKGYFREYNLGYKKGMTLLYRSLIAKSSLLDSDYANWENLLPQEYVAEHMALLDASIPEESKAIELATRIEPITHQQLGVLFYAIGAEATNHTIELLVLNLYLQVPNMKLSETGDSIHELLEGLKYITEVGDVAGLNDLRDKFHDDKESMHLAASMLSDPAKAMLREMVVMGNRVKELREGIKS